MNNNTWGLSPCATNRIQSEQDGQLREQGLYRNYSYDDIGRLVLQAIGETQEEATEDGSLIVEVKNYYDDYTCLQELAQLFPEWAESLNISQQSPMVARGKPTATLCYTSDGNRYFEMYQYNSKGLVSDKLSIYDGQWMKTINTTYNFVGDTRNIKESIYTLNNGKKSLLAGRRTTNSYYSGTRLLKKVQVTQLDQKGNTNTQIVSSPKYDVFGNMTSNDRPDTAADMMYTYDTLHGWVKEISSPSGFNEILLRENASNAQFSGNIGSIQWKNTKKGELHKYDYTYDSLGRLIDSRYSSSATDNDGHFDEFVGYNANGSIISLLRNGMKNDGTFGLIDNLEINYDGNRLLNVEDRAESLNYNGAQDFNDGDNSEVEYEYDSNGALKRDSNRGIDIISYDYGHHPNNVSMGMRHIRYDYTPDGRKLSTSHATTISKRITNVTTDTYIDGLILRNGKPQMWQFGGGYVELDDNGTPTSWNYYITDHLGSTRMVVDSNNNIKETINYYPFGSEMRMSNPYQIIRKNSKMNLETAGFTMPADSAVNIKEPGIMMPIDSVAKGNEPALAYEDYWQRYRFSGKELDKQNGLNMYDFGARLFDVAGVPMWTSIDPLAEKNYPYSPYSYCAGDPVNKIDPDGKMPTDREAAIISQHVYDGEAELEGGWRLNGERQQLKNGLTYGIYYRENEGSTEYVLAFGGSHEISDYMTDIKQAVGMPDSQYGMAKELGEKFNCLYDGYEKTIVGHSLGGGLSQVASMATGINAITFNPAAVHNNTKNALGLSNAPTGQIKNIIVRGDIVTSVQDASNFAKSRLNVEGRRKYIGPRKHKFSLLEQFTNHVIQTAINFLKK